MLMMQRTRKRIKQFAVALLAVLSLSVASVAACACSHHAVPSEPKASCHGPTHQTVEADSGSPAFNESCNCLIASTELSVKAETFKLKKLPSVFTATMSTGRSSIASEILYFFPLRASLSYDRLKSSGHLSRGPPVR